MPSPRAVLADITDLGLHPAEKHKVVGASGRLRAKVQLAPKTIEQVESDTKIEILVEKQDEVMPVLEQCDDQHEIFVSENKLNVTDELKPVNEKKSRKNKKQISR